MCFIKGVLFLIFLSHATAVIPNYIHVCEANDPEISKCIVKVINEIKPKLRGGIPELDVPAMEPLHLDAIRLRRGVQSNITDLKVFGASSFQILELKAHIPSNTFTFKLKIPRLEFGGKYELNMNLLFITLQGNGPIYGNFTDYAVDVFMKGNKIMQNGEEYLKFDKMKLNVRLGAAQLRLENLFNGDKFLGDATNAIVNDNIDIFINEIKPSLENALSEKLTDIANRITLRFTYKELFL
ncbi:PREDICTED: protein takeout-like [Nicrophorus vespilloides]|uniref:Protein takeout-like n=1 Tax=Nicrophorus vespilloides TaxID=110193 RepID=A0ABM1N2B4_NICVS|nr:PREDICTED: protein takeout-like [Nicrophorus vespilloides]